MWWSVVIGAVLYAAVVVVGILLVVVKAWRDKQNGII